MSDGQNVLDRLTTTQGGTIASNKDHILYSVLGVGNEVGVTANASYLVQAGAIIVMELTETIAPTATTSVPTTTPTTSIPVATTSVPTATTSIKTTTTSIPTATTSAPTTTSSAPITTSSIAVKYPPIITGSPTTKATPGLAYNFTPTASDADGDALAFSITHMPPWASFNTTTGALTGTPVAKDYGIYGTIVISVTAGTDTVALPAFDLTVEDITKPVALDVPDGTFTTAQAVTLTCQDDGSGCAALYYTLDGTTPTTSSTRYTAPVTVSATATLKYIAVDKSGLVSDVRTKNFTINATLPTVTITYPTDGSAFNSENSLSAISGSMTKSGDSISISFPA